MYAHFARVAPHGFNGIFAMIVNDKDRLSGSTGRPETCVATQGQETT